MGSSGSSSVLAQTSKPRRSPTMGKSKSSYRYVFRCQKYGKKDMHKTKSEHGHLGPNYYFARNIKNIKKLLKSDDKYKHVIIAKIRQGSYKKSKDTKTKYTNSTPSEKLKRKKWMYSGVRV